jgi:hypothetical protein
MCKSSGPALVLAVVVVGAVPLGLLDSTRAGDKPTPVKQRAAALAKADAEWVEKGDGKLTEADLVARLGPADELKSPGGAVADYAMVWRDRTMIRVKFEKDKVVEYSGSFSDRLPHKRVTPQSLKKLKQGMSESEVEEILSVREQREKDYHYWGDHRTLIVYVKDGKVAGYQWGSRNWWE